MVVIIGLLAALAIPSFKHIHDASRSTTAFNDLRVLRDAVRTYALSEGEYPDDTPPGSFSNELSAYIVATEYAQETPIGGLWDIDTTTYAAAVGVAGYTVDDDLIAKMDNKYDDGDIASGQLQVYSGGFYWIIDE